MEHRPALLLPPVTLVLGGARSGKSTHAEKLVTGSLFGAAPRPAVYIATAQAGDDIDEATDELLQSLDGYKSVVVFVSNEVGLGLVPETPLGRSFRDAQGRLNMRIAECADRVILIAAGLPLTMKDRPPRSQP